MASDFFELIGRRFSCRNYSDRQVSRDDIMRVLEAARMAPSACNRQPWRFFVATDDAVCQAIRSCYERDWINTAKNFIVCLGDHSEAWHRADGKDHTDVDIAIAVEHICLAATDMGLATCWICNFDADRLRAALSVPSGLEPIAILPLGYPAYDAVPAKKRKTLDDIVVWEKF